MWAAHVTVATVIQQDGAFLVVEEKQKSSDRLVFNQPAGHVEAGETLIEAAQRETREETGYTVAIDYLIGIYTYSPPNDAFKTYYRFCFAAHIVEHHPQQPLDECIVQALFLSKQALINTERLRSPLVLQCIEDFEKGQKFPLNLIYEHA